MHRRSLLAASATLGTGLLAGCLGSGDGGGTTTAAPSGEVGCPRYSDRIETVVCTPALADPEGRMAMRPARSTGTLPETSLSFALRNERDSRFESNFYHWRIQKYVDGRWHHVVPLAWPEPLMYLEPGGSHTWDVAIDNTDLARTLPHPQGSDAVTVAGLGGGTYSFGVEGRFAGGPEALTAFVTRFELDGPALDLPPTPDVEDRERRGDRVVLTWRRDGGSRVTYRVTALKSVPDDARPVIAEQAVRDDALRNALALFERWTRIVEIRTNRDALSMQQFGDGDTIAYRDTAYRIEVVPDS